MGGPGWCPQQESPEDGFSSERAHWTFPASHRFSFRDGPTRVPQHRRSDVSRTTTPILVNPILESLCQQIKDKQGILANLRTRVTTNEWADDCWQHPLVANSAEPVLPVALYCDGIDFANAMASLASSRQISSLRSATWSGLCGVLRCVDVVVATGARSAASGPSCIGVAMPSLGTISRCPPRQEGLEPRRRNTRVRCGRIFGFSWGHHQDQGQLDGARQDIRSADTGQPRCSLKSVP